MAKDPAFLFYPSDFLTGTMFMTNEQLGIYIRLLCSQHQHGGIIDKDSFNALVCNNTLIKNKFIETETGFYNERLTIEMDKRNKKSNNMSDTAKEVWKKRKEQMQYKSKENEYNCNTNVQENDTIVIQPVNVNRDININEDNSIIPTFEIFKNYALEKKPKVSLDDLKLKYDGWVVNNWKDGKDKKITNWKTKLLNTLPYIKESEQITIKRPKALNP